MGAIQGGSKMDMTILKRKIDGYRDSAGSIKNVSPELLLELRQTWEHYTGSTRVMFRYFKDPYLGDAWGSDETGLILGDDALVHDQGRDDAREYYRSKNAVILNRLQWMWLMEAKGHEVLPKLGKNIQKTFWTSDGKKSILDIPILFQPSNYNAEIGSGFDSNYYLHQRFSVLCARDTSETNVEKFQAQLENLWKKFNLKFNQAGL
jgi:hypothetical protein